MHICPWTRQYVDSHKNLCRQPYIKIPKSKGARLAKESAHKGVWHEIPKWGQNYHLIWDHPRHSSRNSENWSRKIYKRSAKN